MSGNPRDERSGVPVNTRLGRAIQYYLPGCAPEDTETVVRPEVQRFSIQLKSMLRHYTLTLDEVQHVVRHIFRERNRR